MVKGIMTSPSPFITLISAHTHLENKQSPTDMINKLRANGIIGKRHATFKEILQASSTDVDIKDQLDLAGVDDSDSAVAVFKKLQPFRTLYKHLKHRARHPPLVDAITETNKSRLFQIAKYPGMKFRLLRNGNLWIYSQIEKDIKHAVDLIAVHLDCRYSKIEIDNVVGGFDLLFNISQEYFADKLREDKSIDVQYEQEINPAILLELQNPKANVALYANGKMVIRGVKRVATVFDVLNELNPMLIKIFNERP